MIEYVAGVSVLLAGYAFVLWRIVRAGVRESKVVGEQLHAASAAGRAEDAARRDVTLQRIDAVLAAHRGRVDDAIRDLAMVAADSTSYDDHEAEDEPADELTAAPAAP